MKWFFIRMFGHCCWFAGDDSIEIGEVWFRIESQNIEYVKVGKNKLWIHKV